MIRDHQFARPFLQGHCMVVIASPIATYFILLIYFSLLSGKEPLMNSFYGLEKSSWLGSNFLSVSLKACY